MLGVQCAVCSVRCAACEAQFLLRGKTRGCPTCVGEGRRWGEHAAPSPPPPPGNHKKRLVPDAGVFMWLPTIEKMRQKMRQLVSPEGPRSPGSVEMPMRWGNSDGPLISPRVDINRNCKTS